MQLVQVKLRKNHFQVVAAADLLQTNMKCFVVLLFALSSSKRALHYLSNFIMFFAAAGGPAPAARETVSVGARIAVGVRSAVRAAGIAAASVAEHVGKRATAASRRTADHAASVASGLVTTATRVSSSVKPVPQPSSSFGRKSQSSPLRITLPSFSNERAHRLALVATRR